MNIEYPSGQPKRPEKLLNTKQYTHSKTDTSVNVDTFKSHYAYIPFKAENQPDLCILRTDYCLSKNTIKYRNLYSLSHYYALSFKDFIPDFNKTWLTFPGDAVPAGVCN